MSGRTDNAANFDDRAEPAQATPAGGVAEEVPHDGRASATPPSSAAQGQEWQTCPRCGGQGHVEKPPWVPGDVTTWPATTTASHPCPVCRGAKVLVRP